MVGADQSTTRRATAGGARKYVNGEARTEAILAAARRLFRDHGYPATTIADIGAEAGISGPGIYRHFAGKRDILLQLVDEAVAAHAAAATEARRPLTREARIRCGAAGMVDTALAVRFIFSSFREDGEGRQGSDPSAAPQREMIRVWADFVREENPTASLHEARAVVRMAGGLMQQSLLVVDRLGERRVRELAVPVVEHLYGSSLSTQPRARSVRTTRA